MDSAVAAVDLGATSGRVMLGRVSHNELNVRSIARFPNGPVTVGRELHWNLGGPYGLYASVLDGLAAALRAEHDVASIGVDSWAVDYALLKDGVCLEEPFHYRDERNLRSAERVHAIVPPAELYSRNGLQFLPFNTLYQLAAEPDLVAADTFLLIPDLLDYWFTGRQVAERTNASTTGLVRVETGEWDDALIARLAIPRSLFPELVNAGSVVGPLQPQIAREIGAGRSISVTAVGSHDTASAVVAVPATTEDFAYISCGTWGLVGVELEVPVLTQASRLANFTNEVGVDGRVRYLHNVMGLWLLSESVRRWQEDDPTVEIVGLLAAASSLEAPVVLFDVNDPQFLKPGDMPARIAGWCRDHDAAVPTDRIAFVRSIVESLSVAFADAVREASELSGKQVSVIHIVGGGSQNELLCQLIADRSGMPVLAGPVEATAIGNILVQARALGSVCGSLESLRTLVAAAFSPVRYLPVSSR